MVEVKPIKLYTRNKKFVENILIQNSNPLPEIVQWKGKYYIKRKHEMYMEGRFQVGIGI